MMNTLAHDTQNEVVSYFHNSRNHAIAYRLLLTQKQCDNYSALEQELPNIWEAIRWSYEHKKWEILVAFRNALHNFLNRRGHWLYYQNLNMWACEAATVLNDTLTTIRWTHDLADLRQQQGRYEEAEKIYIQCEKKYSEQNAYIQTLQSRHMRALAIRAQGKYGKAMAVCDSVIAEANQRSLYEWLAHPLYVRALLARDQGRYTYAIRLMQESIVRLDGTHDKVMLAQCYHFLGELALTQGQLKHARLYLEQGLAFATQSGSLRRIATTQRVLGNLARASGAYNTAQQRYDTALEIADRIGDFPERARLLLEQGKLKTRQKQVNVAVLSLRSALSTYREIGHKRGIALVSLHLALLLARNYHLWSALVILFEAFKDGLPLLLEYRHRISFLRCIRADFL